MKHMLWILVISVCFTCVADDDFRIFTDADGRAIEARIISVDARSGKITLQRQNNRKATVPISIFSEKDQTYIQEWVSVQDFLSSSRFRISVAKRKGKTGGGKSQTKREKPPCHYEIQLQNKSGVPFEDMWIEYCIFLNKENSGGKGGVVSKVVEKQKAIDLSSQQKYVAKTKEVKLFRYYTSQSEITYNSDGSVDHMTSYNKTAEDNLEGIIVRAYLKTPSGEQFSREVCEPSSVVKNYTWKNP